MSADHQRAGFRERVERLAEVEAVRPGEDALAELRRLDGVVAADAFRRRAAEIDGVGDGVPEQQLADRVGDQHVDVSARAWRRPSTIAAS